MAEGNNTDRGLRCTICLSDYTEPRLLPCYHIFCTPCLEKLTKESDDIVCPLCRMEVDLPDEGVTGFKLYPFNTKLQNKEQNKNAGCCQLCSDENFATAKCLECQINLCSNCCDYHGKLKASQGHQLELFNNLNQEKIVRDESKLVKNCDEHKLELSQFCKSCNKLICPTCLEKYHPSHKTETVISYAKRKREILLTRIVSLKSRIPIFENTIEVVKSKESTIYKSFNQVKREMQSHAIGLKGVFCRIVDVLLMENVNRIDDISKKDLKCIRTYIDELENEKLSLLCFVRNVEKLISMYSDIDILQHYLDVGQTMDNVLEKKITGQADIHEIHYECGHLYEDLIKSLFGKITDNVVSGAVIPSFLFLPVPALQSNAQKISSFDRTSLILDIASDNAGVWILTTRYLSLHKSDGSLIKEDKLPNDNYRFILLRKSRNEIWFWTGNNAIQRNTGNEGFNVTSVYVQCCCCFINNGNLIVFNHIEKLLYEVTEQEGVKGTIGGEDLQILLTNDVMYMTETKDLRLVIAQKNQIIIIESDGTIVDTFKHKKSDFSSICTDNYGNIISIDQSVPDVSVFSEQADFQYALLTKSENDLQNPTHTIIDEIGNLWLVEDGYTVKIYSYV